MPELEKDFIKLKEDFKNNNTRSFPIYNSDKPLILTIDFSALALGVTVTSPEQEGAADSCSWQKDYNRREKLHFMEGRVCSPSLWDQKV